MNSDDLELALEGLDRFTATLEGLDNFSGADSLVELLDILEERQRRNDPEQMTIQRDGLVKLSREAKEVVRLVIDTPKELLVHVSRKGAVKWLTATDITQYLKHYGWPKACIKAALREVRIYVKEFL
jgi:hypothetical protein